MPTQPRERSYGAAALDRFAGWYLGLGAEKCSYTCQVLKIPTNHAPSEPAVELAADLYQPVTTPKTSQLPPLLLVQTSYGRGVAVAMISARLFAAQGYQVLLVSSRGTFGSGGNFDPGRVEQRDSQAIVAWMRTQPWYPGTFATAGASHLGYAQWALLHDPPRDCVAAVIPAALHDMSLATWGTGALLLQRLEWADLLAHQEDPARGILAKIRSMAASGSAKGLSAVLGQVPLLDSVRSYFGDRAPWVEDWMTRPDIEGDPWWSSTQHGVALERVNIPVLLISGWKDLYSRQSQTLAQYKRLRERGCPVGLVAGPWGHVAACGTRTMPYMKDFLEHYVGGAKEKSPLNARIFVSGAEEWREMESWPPATTPVRSYLHKSSQLRPEPLAADIEASASFVYDPNNPTPTVEPGQDDTAISSRTDVLFFDSGPLESDVEVMGQPVVQLAHSSDTPFADILVRLSEVDPVTGKSHSIAEVFRARSPDRAETPLQLTLSDCAHRFRKGMCIRLTVAGASFPGYARNLGVEGNRVLGETMRPAVHTIFFADGASYLTLPTC